MKITYENVKPLVEGLKETARVVLLSIIPIIMMGIDLSTGEIAINWKIVSATTMVVVLTAILKGIDKDRHLTGKIEGNDTLTGGLTRF